MTTIQRLFKCFSLWILKLGLPGSVATRINPPNKEINLREEEIALFEIRRMLKLRASLELVIFEWIIKDLKHVLEETRYEFRSLWSNSDLPGIEAI
jgi:hypothetical protein